VMGGPMMGFQVQDNQVPVIKTTNCILANPPEPIEMQMPCIRCGECMDACPVNLLPQQLYWYSQSHEFDKVEKLNIDDCIECGCCSYVCPSHIPLVQYYRHAKSEIKIIQEETKAAELGRQRHDFRLARIEREKLERDTRLQAKKDAVKKQVADKLAQTGESPESAVTPSKKPSAAVAAARAAAARRVAKSKTTSTAEDGESDSGIDSPEAPVQEKMPPARRKAIEAAQKASEAAGTEKNPKTAAKNAAMAAAKKRALAKKQAAKSDTQGSNDSPNEASGATETEQKPAKNSGVTDESQSTQTTDLTQSTTSPSAASEKEAARKAAISAAGETVKKQRVQAFTKSTKEVDNVTQDKRQKAIEAARKSANERQAKQQETN